MSDNEDRVEEDGPPPSKDKEDGEEEDEEQEEDEEEDPPEDVVGENEEVSRNFWMESLCRNYSRNSLFAILKIVTRESWMIDYNSS